MGSHCVYMTWPWCGGVYDAHVCVHPKLSKCIMSCPRGTGEQWVALFLHPCTLSLLPCHSVCPPHFLLSPRSSRLPVFFIPSKTVTAMHPLTPSSFLLPWPRP